ncbi:OmpH family outer membrane protein [Winogradskyella poriferorum]|uniref:OmpH family outer membrane protein n=1 Tax=Winogradskyella poriferorum TaxID=307627 RepID=A0ABU7W3Z1_9FLAO
MKKIVVALVTLAIFTSCQKQDKIAFVDNAKVVKEFNKKKNFEAKFQTKIDAFNKKADSLDKAIQMEAQAFQTRAQKMNQSKAEQEYQALVQKKQMQDYQLGNEEKLLKAEGQKEIDTLVKQVKAFVKDYGKKNGYTFILGANEAGSVMYGAEDKDITDAVIKALNGDSKEVEESKEKE